MHEGRQPQAVSGGLHNEEEALSTVQGGGGRSTWGGHNPKWNSLHRGFSCGSPVSCSMRARLHLFRDRLYNTQDRVTAVDLRAKQNTRSVSER